MESIQLKPHIDYYVSKGYDKTTYYQSCRVVYTSNIYTEYNKSSVKLLLDQVQKDKANSYLNWGDHYIQIVDTQVVGTQYQIVEVKDLVDKIQKQMQFRITYSPNTENKVNITWSFKSTNMTLDNKNIILALKTSEILNELRSYLIESSIGSIHRPHILDSRTERMKYQFNVSRKYSMAEQTINTKWTEIFRENNEDTINAYLQDSTTILNDIIKNITSEASVDSEPLEVQIKKKSKVFSPCVLDSTLSTLTFHIPLIDNDIDRSRINHVRLLNIYSEMYVKLFITGDMNYGIEQGFTKFVDIGEYVKYMMEYSENYRNEYIHSIVLCLLMYMTGKHTDRFRLIQKKGSTDDFSDIKYTKLVADKEGLISKFMLKGKQLLEKNDIHKCRGKDYKNYHLKMMIMDFGTDKKAGVDEYIKFATDMLERLNVLTKDEMPILYKVAEYVKFFFHLCELMKPVDITKQEYIIQSAGNKVYLK